MTMAVQDSRPAIDVSKLPSSALDHRSPIWWGNALLLCIETSMFAILLVSYFYFRRNFENWPPPKVDDFPPNYHPLPMLPLGTANLILLLASLIPMIICDRACLKMRENLARVMATIALLMAIASIVLRFKEFGSLIFRWDANAYASICWTILGVHLMHLMILSVEDALMVTYTWIHGLDDKHARDIRVTAVYWYWVVGMWVICYAVVYLSPRFM